MRHARKPQITMLPTLVALLLPLATPLTVRADGSIPKCAEHVSGLPSWMTCQIKERKRRNVLLITGNKGWAGQPVVDRMTVNLRGKTTKVVIDRGMLAQLIVKGSRKADRIELGAQAGTISKRFTSKIKLGKDDKKDIFTFTNTTASHGPFNHAQRIVVQQFGKEDVIRLKNVGRTIRYNDIQADGSIPGVPRLAIRVERLP